MLKFIVMNGATTVRVGFIWLMILSCSGLLSTCGSREFLDHTSDYNLVTRNSAPSSYLIGSQSADPCLEVEITMKICPPHPFQLLWILHLLKNMILTVGITLLNNPLLSQSLINSLVHPSMHPSIHSHILPATLPITPQFVRWFTNYRLLHSLILSLYKGLKST